VLHVIFVFDDVDECFDGIHSDVVSGFDNVTYTFAQPPSVLLRS
jgi:hypothetical protein